VFLEERHTEIADGWVKSHARDRIEGFIYLAQHLEKFAAPGFKTIEKLLAHVEALLFVKIAGLEILLFQGGGVIERNLVEKLVHSPELVYNAENLRLKLEVFVIGTVAIKSSGGGKN